MAEKVLTDLATRPNLFDYFDYRDFLQDFYSFHKRRNSAYSYRLFARKAKLGSPNYLKLVVDGKRRITDRTLYQFSRGLGLSRDEEKYFRELVLYQEVSDPDSKDQHLKALMKYQEKQRTPSPLTEARSRALGDWYHLVIRELVATKNFKEDYAWIAKRLAGKITETQAKESIALLLSLKLLKRNTEGKLEQSEPLLTSSNDVPGHLLRNLHRFYLRRALASIFSMPVEKREMSGLLLAIPAHRLKEVREEIKEFRKKMNRKYGMDKNADDIFYAGLYLFPVTQPISH